MDGPKFSKKRKLGKNKKKSWRGIDITETEDFLEDQRFQERTTGLVADKTDDQLFVVERKRPDTDTNEAPKNAQKTIAPKLKCYSNLKNQSRIRCPRKEYPTGDGYTERSLRSFRVKGGPQKKATDTSPVTPQQQNNDEPVDLWGEEKSEAEDVDDFFKEVTKRKRVKPPTHIKRKCSARAAVEVPHPGASVNPTYDQHQGLLLEAHLVEVKKARKERKIFNALDAKFPAAAPSEATWLSEMSAGLYEDGTAEKGEKKKKKKKGEEDVVDDTERISINPPVSREKKKTPRQKRKEKAAKLLGQVLEGKKVKKKKENKVYTMVKIRSELAEGWREAARRAEEKAKKQEAQKYAPKKLGKHKMEVPDLEVKLSEELVGSLRCIKPEGNVLEDRYKSLQMRNLIEPRKKAHKKKTKTKTFEKKSFREITV